MILDSMLSSLRPPPRAPIWQWAEASIVFGTRQPTARPGPYSVALTPYARAIYDALQDEEIREVVVKKAAQMGATMIGLIWFLYNAANDPAPMLAILSTDDVSDATAERKMVPMIEDSPTVRAEVAPVKYPLKKDAQIFRKCTIDWSGAGSASKLASRSARFLLIDEMNKWPINLADEGNPIDLAKERSKTYWNRKTLEMSTPTTAGGYISRRFDEGDCRILHVACPHCHTMQPLKWERVRFDADLHPDEAGAGAFYECERGCRIEQAEKPAMLAACEWKSTKRASRAGVVSFHLSSLHSPFMSWGQLVTKFLTVKDDPKSLQGFVNNDLGEDWVEKVEQTDDAQIIDRCMPYDYGTDPALCPDVAELVKGLETCIVIACDVQKDYHWMSVRRWWRGGISALIKFEQGYTWSQIEDEIALWKNDPVWIAIDEGYRTEEVHAVCLANGYIPVKGASGKMPQDIVTTVFDPFEGTVRAGSTTKMQRIIIDTDAAKRRLTARQKGQGWGRWMLPRDASEMYRMQVTAERRNEATGEWEMRPGRRHNHAMDCEVYQDAIAFVAKLNVYEPPAKPAN